MREVEEMMVELEVCPDSLLIRRRGVTPMLRAKGIPRVAWVRETTMNPRETIGMSKRGSMVF